MICSKAWQVYEILYLTFSYITSKLYTRNKMIHGKTAFQKKKGIYRQEKSHEFI